MRLDSILPLEAATEYKLHLASWNGQTRPLDAFVRDREEWHAWNRWRSNNDDFNRRFILALIEFFPEPGQWLFGGIYEVLGSTNQPRTYSYDTRSCDAGADMVGRLQIGFDRPGRAKSLCLENHLDRLAVTSLFREVYTGQPFPGYEGINHAFSELETIFRTQRPDWKAALQNVKGVYAVFDRSNGKKYVGSAYGGTGIWARWSEYMATGHGYSDELTALIGAKGIGYAREHFRLCLLEYRSAKTDDGVLIEREGFWKQALLSRGTFGYNIN